MIQHLKMLMILEPNLLFPIFNIYNFTTFITFPALIKSASTLLSSGYAPTPKIPFSLYNSISIFGSKNCGKSVGMPIPRLMYIPFFISLAALVIILSLMDVSFYFPPPDDLLVVIFSILFSDLGAK